MPRTAETPPPTAAAPLSALQLLVVTGKGGVGKTTVAAGLGAALAAAGRRTLVLEVDPRENAHRMLGVPPSGGEVVTAAPRLYLQNLRPRDVLDGVVRDQVRVSALVRRVLGSEVYRHFAEGAPGLKELAVLGHALRLLRGYETVRGKRRGGRRASPDIDVVLLDAPATGHGLAMLLAPRLVADTIRQGPFSDLAGQLATFVDDPRRCGVLVTTAAEEMPMQEGLELLARLRGELAREAAAVVVNALYPPWPEGERKPPASDRLGRLWRDRRAVNERELGRLHETWRGPTAELPLLAEESGPRLLDRLRPALDALASGHGEGGA